MSESLSYLTPFQQAIRNVLGYDPFTLRSTTAPQNTSVVEQLLAAERARASGAPLAPAAPSAPGAPTAVQDGSPTESAPSVVSPDQSISGLLNALNTARSVATGPFGLATAFGSLALSDIAGRDPSFNIGTRGAFGALSDIFGFTPAVPNDRDDDDAVSDLPQAAIDPGRTAMEDYYTEYAAAAGANAVNPGELAESIAMEEGRQSPAFGFGSYGFGTNPGRGFGSGDFSALNQTERDDAVTAALGHEHGLDAYGNPGGAPGATPGVDAAAAAAAANTDADAGPGGVNSMKAGGLVPLAGGGKIAIGPGGGLDDLIPTSINGRRAAALSDGEFVMPADVVSMMGDGSSNAGARRLYDLVRQIRESKTGTSRQAGPLPVGEILKRTMS